MIEEELVWKVRAFVYRWFAEHAGAPEVDDIAQEFGITLDRAGNALVTLHDKHALFLEPGTTSLRMASPFSAIPTPHRTTVTGKSYWANCAWDSLGIPAALHAPDAAIESVCAASGDAIRIQLKDGQVEDTGAVVHILLPFRNWYENMVHT